MHCEQLACPIEKRKGLPIVDNPQFSTTFSAQRIDYCGTKPDGEPQKTSTPPNQLATNSTTRPYQR
jgi:hypothetical protein